MKIHLLDLDKSQKQSNKIYYYLDWFKESWVHVGGKVHTKIDVPRKIRLVSAKLKLGRKTFFSNNKKALLVIGGSYLDYTAFPYNYLYEMIPIFWDTWEKYHPLLISSLKRNNVKYAFFTQREVAKMVEIKVPGLKTFWMPEGVDINAFNKGGDLCNRSIDIVQYGRRFDNYHNIILNTINKSQRYLFSQPCQKFVFETFKDLVYGLSNTKISICFPRSITDPVYTGGIETLTQRYWEAILSRSLIIGKAPKELIDLMGYNPVIEVDWKSPESQLNHILNSIDEYQDFVNKNYKKARSICSWDYRVNSVIKVLKELGYNI